MAQGHIGGAVVLSGTSYVQLPANILDTHDTVTITTWINMASVDWWARVFDFGSSSYSCCPSVPASPDNGYMFVTIKDGGGNMHFELDNFPVQGKDSVVFTPGLSAGTWQHLAFRVVPTGPTAGYHIWVNGALYAVTPFASGQVKISDLAPMTTLYLGKSRYGDAYLQAQIDDFRIYTRALADAEIAALAAQ